MPPNNILPSHGNEKTMNLNTMILTNIQASPYFKVQLYELKTYHQVIDEIYTRVTHLEPWEKGSRKTAGQTGMCGGVRGVGAGGIVSSCFCLLYKLYTLKLTRKQLVGIMTHTDSPYIRGIGFMYARFSQPPGDLWDWFEPYLDDEEEIDVKAGGGHVMTIGEMVHHFLTKLEWYSTLFPRIPVPIQKQIEQNLLARKHAKAKQLPVAKQPSGPTSQADVPERDRERESTQQYSRERRELPYDSREVDRIYGRTATERDDTRDREHQGSRSRGDDVNRDRRRSRSPGHHRSSHHPKSDRERDRDKRRSRSVDKHSKHDHRRSVERELRHDDRKRSAERDLKQHADRRSRSRSHHHHSRSRSRSRDKHRSSKKHSSQPHHPASDEYQQDLHRELERIRKSRSHDHNGR